MIPTVDCICMCLQSSRPRSNRSSTSPDTMTFFWYHSWHNDILLVSGQTEVPPLTGAPLFIKTHEDSSIENEDSSMILQLKMRILPILRFFIHVSTTLPRHVFNTFLNMFLNVSSPFSPTFSTHLQRDFRFTRTRLTRS